MSAICCAAKALSHELRVEKMVPAIAVPVRELDKFEVFSDVLEVNRPFGRF